MGCCKQAPSIRQQAVTASKALGRVVAAVLDGKPIFIPEEQAQLRLAACAQCDQCRTFPNGFMQCLQCGCGLNGKARRKAYMSTEKCPLGKWP